MKQNDWDWKKLMKFGLKDDCKKELDDYAKEAINKINNDFDKLLKECEEDKQEEKLSKGKMK